MPYPKAHYYVLFVVAVIAVGFWPSYFSVLATSPWQFHAHGVIASLWVVMVAGQSWTAHSKSRLELHRSIGKASLFLFPFLIAGLFAIIDRTGKGYLANDDPVRMMFGGSFLMGMAIAAVAYVAVFYNALKWRRKVWLHSRPCRFRTHSNGHSVVDGVGAHRRRGAVVEIPGKGDALPGRGGLHHRANDRHGVVERPVCPENAFDGRWADTECRCLAYGFRHRGADKLARLAGRQASFGAHGGAAKASLSYTAYNEPRLLQPRARAQLSAERGRCKTRPPMRSRRG